MRLDFLLNFGTWVLRTLMLVFGVMGLANANYTTFGLNLLGILFSFLPEFLNWRLRVKFPYEYGLVLAIMLFGSFSLGEGLDFYERFRWWDMWLHASSGFLLALVGFLLGASLLKSKDTHSRLLALFSFCFSVMCGVLWEIWEFGMDRTFGLTMQKNSLINTMLDLILNTLTAWAFAILAFQYTNGRRVWGINALIERFFRANPRLLRHH